MMKKIQRAYLIQSGLRPPRIAPATSDQLTPIAAISLLPSPPEVQTHANGSNIAAGNDDHVK